MTVDDIVGRQDWAAIEAQLSEEGYAVLAGALGEDLIAELMRPRSPLTDDLRRHLHPHLAPIANRWNAVLDEPAPDVRQAAFARLTHQREGEDEPLHQAASTFPLQLVALLSEPGRDFTGGEFVMTEQRPRMQSRPMVLPLRRGSLAVITVAQRPHPGSKGPYRVNLKHAVSRVRSGERWGLELLFDGKP